ncbi:hypothetical protein CYMTET_32240, partial [Cymbomonas tetramitiformis]
MTRKHAHTFALSAHVLVNRIEETSALEHAREPATKRTSPILRTKREVEKDINATPISQLTVNRIRPASPGAARPSSLASARPASPGSRSRGSAAERGETSAKHSTCEQPDSVVSLGGASTRAPVTTGALFGKPVSRAAGGSGVTLKRPTSAGGSTNHHTQAAGATSAGRQPNTAQAGVHLGANLAELESVRIEAWPSERSAAKDAALGTYSSPPTSTREDDDLSVQSSFRSYGADLEDITEDPSADHFEEHAEHLAGRRVLEGEEEAADGTQYANYKKRIAELEKQLQQQTEACRNASH